MATDKVIEKIDEVVLSKIKVHGDPDGRLDNIKIELDGKPLPFVKAFKIEATADDVYAQVTLQMYAQVDLDLRASVDVDKTPLPYEDPACDDTES